MQMKFIVKAIEYKGDKMKMGLFLFFMLSLVFGDFTILFVGYWLNWNTVISYLLGGLWGFVAGIYLQRGLKDERR